MQVNSVNSTNFKSNYNFDNVEAEKMVNAAKTLEDMLPDKFVKNTDDDGNEVQKKSFLGTALAVAGTALISFAIAKKFITKGADAIKNVMANEKAQKALNSVKDFTSKNLESIGKKINSNEKLSGVLETVKNGKVAKIAGKTANVVKSGINKVGAANVLAGIGGIAGATYISKTDSNNDGVADIAQKGVNAYKGAIDKMGIIGDAIQALS